MAAVPVAADLYSYLDGEGLPSLEDLQALLDVEAAAQADVCLIPEVYPLPLREALLRRCARNLAARRVPIATFTSFEGGGTSSRVPSTDAEVSRLEGPYRRLGVA